MFICASIECQHFIGREVSGGNMKCPVCGSDRDPQEKKCSSCGVIYESWVKKIVSRLEMTKKKVVDGTTPKRVGPSTEKTSEGKYKESFDLEDI